MAEQRCSKTTHTTAIPNKAGTDEQAVLAEATDKKQLTCILNQETEKMLNGSDAVLEHWSTCIAAFKTSKAGFGSCKDKGFQIK